MAAVRQKADSLLSDGKVKDALELLEKIQASDQDNRASLVELTRALEQDKNPIRAGNFLTEYLTRHRNDEELQNALGDALLLVEPAKWNAAYDALERFYSQYDEELNHTRTDGTRRWGAQWIEGPDAEKNWSRFRQAKREFLAAQSAWRKAQKSVDDLTQQRADAVSRAQVGGPFAPPDIAAFDRGILTAQQNLGPAQDRWIQAQSSLTQSQPPFQ
jgi:hypothetical protein